MERHTSRGLRSLAGDTCEMKRLDLRPQARGQQLGRKLAERICEEACSAGYSLDSLPGPPDLHTASGFNPTCLTRFQAGTRAASHSGVIQSANRPRIASLTHCIGSDMMIASHATNRTPFARRTCRVRRPPGCRTGARG